MRKKKPIWKKILDRNTFLYFCKTEYGYYYNELIEIAHDDFNEFNKLFVNWINSYFFNDWDREFLIKALNLEYLGVLYV